MKVMDYLLSSEPYVEYAVRLNILTENKESLTKLRQTLLSDERIKQLLASVSEFNKKIVSSHKNADLPLHQLVFLLDIGLDTEVPEIKKAIEQILNNIDEDGMYKNMMNIPIHFGGTGKDALAWALCDAPLMLYTLLRAGVSYEDDIHRGVEYIITLQRRNGFPCVVSKELGKFRGPGKKDDCCPYATLIILKLLELIPEYKNSDITKICIDELLYLWENSKTLHPYMFFMGTDFRKLKAPLLWYDIVSVADCLSRFEDVRNDDRFLEMLAVIEEKMDINNCFIPESVYLKCKDCDFGQKKEPSAWLTYLCLRILERCGRINFE